MNEIQGITNFRTKFKKKDEEKDKVVYDKVLKAMGLSSEILDKVKK